jgi:hypothetical protein
VSGVSITRRWLAEGAQRPGWAGNHIGFYPFPTGIAGEAADEGQS